MKWMISAAMLAIPLSSIGWANNGPPGHPYDQPSANPPKHPSEPSLPTPSQPMLPTEQPPAPPVPPFAFPSNLIVGTPVPYPMAADPQTGTLVPTHTIDQPNSPSNAPADTTDTQFLTYVNGVGKRLDTPLSACQYYQVIGAVQGCGAAGEVQGAIDFATWKQMVKIDQPGIKTDTAQFINQVDLNLTRDHHMVVHGPTQAAAYVCNHKPPAPTLNDPTAFFPSQTDINAAIATIKKNSNTIACVAMEFSASTTLDPNNPNPPGIPFTKFWIFGPPEDGGKLLTTVDLDGRGPKGVPNVCTACHGGTFDYNKSAGPGVPYVQFDPAATPITFRPNGDLRAHFLPFDLQNFAFARDETQSQADQDATRAAQEAAIFALNLDVYTIENYLASAPTASFGSLGIRQLIEGWYDNHTTPGPTAPPFDVDFRPNTFFEGNYPQAYWDAYSHSCRTCHIAMDRQPFEYGAHTTLLPSDQAYVCAHYMPNARVTFDRFWLSSSGRGLTNQPGFKRIPGQQSSVNPDQVFALGAIFPDLINVPSCKPQ